MQLVKYIAGPNWSVPIFETPHKGEWCFSHSFSECRSCCGLAEVGQFFKYRFKDEPKFEGYEEVPHPSKIGQTFFGGKAIYSKTEITHKVVETEYITPEELIELTAKLKNMYQNAPKNLIHIIVDYPLQKKVNPRYVWRLKEQQDLAPRFIAAGWVEKLRFEGNYGNPLIMFMLDTYPKKKETPVEVQGVQRAA